MQIGSHKKGRIEHTGINKADEKRKQPDSQGFLPGFLWESTIFGVVFTVLICIFVYMQTGELNLKIAGISFVGMFLASTVLLGGVRRSVEKRLASLEDEENNTEASEGEKQEDPD